MKCGTLRDALTRGDAPSPQMRSHLEGCDRCRKFAEAWGSAREGLRRHRHDHAPDPSFSARVLAALPPRRERDAADALGWAALRLLPATLALLAILGGWSLVGAPEPAAVQETGTQDLLAWVVEDGFPQSGESIP